MPLDVGVHRFLEADVLGQAFDGANVVTDGEVEISVGLPLSKLLHGADVVSPVVALEPESFEFAVADFDGREFGFPSGFVQVRELLPDTLRPRVIGERVNVALVFDERPSFALCVGRAVEDLPCRVALGNDVGVAVNRDGNVPDLDHCPRLLSLLLLAFAEVPFHAGTVPSLSRPVKHYLESAVKYGGGGGS